MKYELTEAYPILENLIKKEKLILLVGSGISLESGIPLWDGFILSYMEMIKNLNFYDEEDKADLNKIIDDALKRRSENRFNPIEIATVLKNRLKLVKELRPESHSLAKNNYKKWMTDMFLEKEYNIKHELIVKTNYPYILTSNYDNLLQVAANNNNYLELSSNVLSYINEMEILKSISNNLSRIIHIHGISVDNIDELVFTKEDYNRLILKKHEIYSFSLRVLFTKYSTLFVGYGSSDPHLDEIFEEINVNFFSKDDQYKIPESYLVVRRDKADSILEKYKERIGMNLILIDDYSDYKKLLEYLQSKAPRTA